MKRKNKKAEMKKSMSFAIFPMFGYFLLNFLASLAYVAVIAFPKIVDHLEKNPGMTSAQINDLYNSIVIEDTLILMVMLNALVIFYGLYSFIRRESKYFDKRYHNKMQMKDVVVLTVFAIGLYFAVNIVLTIILPLFGSLQSSMGELAQAVDGMMDGGIIASVVVIGVLAPIAEELLLRGLVFNRLRYMGTIPFAVGTSAFIFALFHMNLVQFIYTFALGVVFAWVYYKYENILATIILHVFYNLSSFIFMIEPLHRFFSTVGGVVAFYVLGVGIMFAGVKYIRAKERPQLKAEYIAVVKAEEAEFDVDRDDTY